MPVKIGPDEYADSNGNGRYDSGEPLTYDWNGNGIYDAFPPDPLSAAKLRLDGLRDLMRMELPDRWSDIADIDKTGLDPVVKTTAAPPYGMAVPFTGVPASSSLQAYFRKVQAANLVDPTKPSLKFQSAECLYMIVMAAAQEDGDGRDAFRSDTYGDVDGDGFPEFLDGWGHPIAFLRWAPGFASEANIVAQGTVHTASVTPDLVTVTVVPGSAASFSILSGTYVGCVMSDGNPFNPYSVARITGYVYDPVSRIATFSFGRLPGGGPTPFGGTGPDGPVTIVGPDPFDPMNVYPIFSPPVPDMSATTWGLYPLIYSAGSDGAYGLRSDARERDPIYGVPADGDYPLNYRSPSIAMNPFYKSPLSGEMLGVPTDTYGRAPNMEPYVNVPGAPNGWRDNIHNHMQVSK